MYVQFTKPIIYALDYLTDNYEIEISTGKNDTVNLRVLFPKVDCDDELIKETIQTLIERFGAEHEKLYGEPVVWDRSGYLIHFLELQSERLKV